MGVRYSHLNYLQMAVTVPAVVTQRQICCNAVGNRQQTALYTRTTGKAVNTTADGAVIETADEI